jgi:hypothetical protein
MQISSFFVTLASITAATICSVAAQVTNSNEQAAPRIMEPVTVFGERASIHNVTSESDLVGPANQPEWTTRRAFAEADIYVIPTGEIEFNQFYISSHARHGKPENLFESEFEFGLPWRTQLDVEPNYRVENGEFRFDSMRLELPHALADWGKIPLNPTIDGGWRFRNGEADSFLFRLLFAEQLGERWHLGVNLGFEHQVGGERETEYELNAAVSYVAKDRRLTLGAELLVEHETAKEDPSETEVLLGPTLLYKPTRNTHLGLVPLFGLTSDAPVAEVFLIFGIDFEPFSWFGSNKSESGRSERGFEPVRRPR